MNQAPELKGQRLTLRKPLLGYGSWNRSDKSGTGLYL